MSLLHWVMISPVKVIMLPFEVDGIWNHFWTNIFVVVLAVVNVGLDGVFSFFAKQIDNIINSIVDNFVQIVFVK